ncbi:MAG: lytic transglycosylase domain-containing protein [bacterium]
MKTAAAIVLVLALIGMFPKSKKHPDGRYVPPPAPVTQTYECFQPDSVVVDQSRVERIVRFGQRFFSRRGISESTMRDVAYNIVKYSTAHCIEPELIAALVARESGFNPRAVSRNGAMGLGQLIPSTARSMGVNDPYDIQDNLRGTTRYFKNLLNMWNGYSDQIERSLASYYFGPRVVENAGGVPNRSGVKEFIRDIFSYREKMLSD